MEVSTQTEQDHGYGWSFSRQNAVTAFCLLSSLWWMQAVLQWYWSVIPCKTRLHNYLKWLKKTLIFNLKIPYLSKFTCANICALVNAWQRVGSACYCISEQGRDKVLHRIVLLWDKDWKTTTTHNECE